MISSREIFSEIETVNNDFLSLSEGELHRLHQVLLEILADILKVAKECNAQIMLSGGSLLGAVRHNGFIPWDDDLDLMAFRNDYEKILTHLENNYSDKYYVYAPNHAAGNINTFAKVVKKGTLLVSFANLGSSHCNGVAVEIFPIDYCSPHIFVRKFTAKVLKFISLVSVSATFFSFKNKKTKELMVHTKKGRYYYYLRINIVGRIASTIGFQRLNNLFDKISRMWGQTEYVTVATGRNGYLNECQLAFDMEPDGVRMFQYLPVPVPKNWNIYLTSLYGDYSIIPPVEKREHHFYLEIKI